MNGNALEIHGLTKTFHDFKLDDISFSLPAGFIMGLVGKNGAGNQGQREKAEGIRKKEKTDSS